MIHSIRSSVVPVDPSIVPWWVSETFFARCFAVATITVLTYDAVDKEAQYFWKVPRKPVDFVYFLNRYNGIFGAASILFWYAYGINIEICNFAQWAASISNSVTIVLIDCTYPDSIYHPLLFTKPLDILVVRVLALYSSDRRLSILLWALLTLEALFKLALLIYVVHSEHFVVGGLAKDVVVCASSSTAPWKWGLVDWLIPMIYATILMFLALYKAAEYWKMSAGFKGFTLLRVLLRDQALYFMLVISCCVFNILQFRLLVTNVFSSHLLTALGNPAFLSVLGSRMLFNLKEAGERGDNEGTSYRTPSTTVSDINFAERTNRQRESDTDASDTLKDT